VHRLQSDRSNSAARFQSHGTENDLLDFLPAGSDPLEHAHDADVPFFLERQEFQFSFVVAGYQEVAGVSNDRVMQPLFVQTIEQPNDLSRFLVEEQVASSFVSTVDDLPHQVAEVFGFSHSAVEEVNPAVVVVVAVAVDSLLDTLLFPRGMAIQWQRMSSVSEGRR